MPHDFVERKRQYRLNGRYVTRHQQRAEVQKLIDFTKREAARYGEQYAKGQITTVAFEIKMRELLKAAHTVSASVGRGGWTRMAQSDWGAVGAKMRWQYSFLQKFVRKLVTGKIAKAFTAGRAQSYASSIYISYENARREAQTEFVEGGGDTNPKDEMLCYLVQNSEEGCSECEADAAAGPMPVSEMGDLGTRLCGDFCKCEIVFEDEPEYDPK